jgi:hypothetical protein
LQTLGDSPQLLCCRRSEVGFYLPEHRSLSLGHSLLLVGSCTLGGWFSVWNSVWTL